MTTIEKSIEVDVPVPVAYNQWTQFEEFPQFMEGVEEVRQLDDKRLHWKASILGVIREWDAEIVDQTDLLHGHPGTQAIENEAFLARLSQSRGAAGDRPYDQSHDDPSGEPDERP